MEFNSDIGPLLNKKKSHSKKQNNDQSEKNYYEIIFLVEIIGNYDQARLKNGRKSK